MELEQKFEVFHCYNGLGGSSRGVDGVYGEKNMAMLVVMRVIWEPLKIKIARRGPRAKTRIV